MKCKPGQQIAPELLFFPQLFFVRKLGSYHEVQTGSADSTRTVGYMYCELSDQRISR